MESINQFISGNRAMLQYLLEKNPDFWQVPRISIQELLALKDHLHIPDDQWVLLTTAFGLGKEHSRHQIEKERKRVNQTFSLKPTLGKLGYIIVLNQIAHRRACGADDFHLK